MMPLILGNRLARTMPATASDDRVIGVSRRQRSQRLAREFTVVSDNGWISPKSIVPVWLRLSVESTKGMSDSHFAPSWRSQRTWRASASDGHGSSATVSRKFLMWP